MEMESETLRADVFYLDKRAGTLTKTRTGYEFEYDLAYLADRAARPISLSMPLQSDKYVSRQLFSFFEGLLPEGWLLDLISATAKIDKNDKFRLLLHTGSDPIGAVSIRSSERYRK
jgi:serine/threonine-protein kinase HipA